MALFTSPAQAWVGLAQSLGLTAYQPTASYSYGTSFRQMKRVLGMPARGASDFRHWLYGTRNGLEVIVLTFDVGSGSSSMTYTGVIARIDPPLFLGLGVRKHGFLDRFGSTDLKVGEPAVDDALHITSFDPRQAVTLMSPHDRDGRDLLAETIALRNFDPKVTDSLVMLAREGTISDPAHIAGMLESATSLARHFATRRQAMPLTQRELGVQGEWRTFAERERFRFDAPRMKLEGVVSGAVTEIGLETEGQVVRTSVTVRFPRAVDVAFAVRRAGLPGFLQGVFSQDITIGDAAFDDMFIVTGYPEAAVRAALAKPEIIALLVGLGTKSTETLMNHAGLYFSLPGAICTTGDLHDLADAGRTASDALFGGVKSLGPYR
jgi:hypothetical protein